MKLVLVIIKVKYRIMISYIQYKVQYKYNIQYKFSLIFLLWRLSC